MTLKNFLFILMLLAVFDTAVVAQQPEDDHFPGRLLLQPTAEVTDATIDQIVLRHGGKVHHKIGGIHVIVLEVPEQAMDGIATALLKTGMFTFVERDHYGHAAATPNDAQFASQWHLAKIQAPAAWDLTKGSAPIAILDSGVDTTHPDLAPKLLSGWSFLTGTSNVSDVLGHGTAVAGAAAAATNNLTGVAGVGWSNPILPLVVLNSSSAATYSNIASAINYAADHGVRIISISIGGTSSSSTLQSAVNYAWNKGAVVFAAAMNNSSTTPMYPAACTNVIAVSATEPADTLASFSNYGSWIDVAAPGDMILTTEKGGGYGYWYGTSLATPIAAAVGALALSANPGLTAAGLVSLLEKNADDIGAPGFDNYFGWGRVNAYKTVLAAKGGSSDTTAPTVSISAPLSGASVWGTVAVTGTSSDNVAVSRIDSYVDGILSGSASSSSFAITWNTASSTNGAHTLTVKAYDAAGNIGSASVTVSVNNAASDTTPPTVSLSSPLSGASVSGTIAVQGAASDNLGVAKVEFYCDGSLYSTTTSTSFSFSLNTSSLTNGSHTVMVKAYDTSGNSASASRTVSVSNSPAAPDATAPAVALTSPLNGSTVSRSVTISASATDNVGVARVSIYVDNVLLCTDTLAPYSCNWNTRKAATGSHAIAARAWDTAGNAGYSSVVTVTVTK